MISARLASLAVVALFVASASAEGTQGSSSMSSSMSGSMSGGMSGPMAHSSSMHHSGAMHTMPATVNSVDMKTGLVEVTSAGMALKLHFPPPTLAGVKAGDKITLHLGFTKP